MTNNNKNNGVSVKDTTVETPLFLSTKIYKELSRKSFHNILDIGSFRGNLSKPFKAKRNTKIIGLDIIDDYKNNFDSFIHKDFLETTKEDFKGLNIDLIISNPPFQQHKQYGELYPQLFIEHAFKLFGKSIPMVIIVGQWLLSNSSKRMKHLNNYNLTKTITLHKNIFAPKSVEASVLYFNIKVKKPFDFISDKAPEKIIKTKTVAFTQEQVKFINSNINNFSGEVKALILSKYKDFPM